MDQHGPILVTVGFIGSHVAERLLRDGRTVVGVDNFDPFYDIRLKRKNLEVCAAAGAAGRFELLPPTSPTPSRSGRSSRVRPEGGIHLAAKAGVRPSIDDPVGYARANVLGTSGGAGCGASRAECSRVVAASSSSVYGNCPTAPFAEDMDVSEPISPYAATKRACKLLGYTHWRLTGMPTAMLRFLHGLRAQAAARSGDPPVSRAHRGGGNVDGVRAGRHEPRLHVHRRHRGGRAGVVPANRRVRLSRVEPGERPADQLDEMVAAIERAVEKEPKVKRPRPGDVERTWADLTRSRADWAMHPKNEVRGRSAATVGVDEGAAVAASQGNVNQNKNAVVPPGRGTADRVSHSRWPQRKTGSVLVGDAPEALHRGGLLGGNATDRFEEGLAVPLLRLGERLRRRGGLGGRGDDGLALGGAGGSDGDLVGLLRLLLDRRRGAGRRSVRRCCWSRAWAGPSHRYRSGACRGRRRWLTTPLRIPGGGGCVPPALPPPPPPPPPPPDGSTPWVSMTVLMAGEIRGACSPGWAGSRWPC